MSGSVSVKDHGSRLGSVNGSGQDGEWFKTQEEGTADMDSPVV